MIDMANVDKPLTKELCKQWIVTLRSGAYLQGQSENRYCCLGVLNEIANLGVPWYTNI